MAPIPPILVRIAATFLTQILTRRLQQSPLFFRMVDRMLHEADHFQSHRLQGKPVPPYISRDPQEPTVREMAEDAWKRRVDDPGEPHDEPNPFATPSSSASSSPASNMRASSSSLDEDAQRQRARDSFRAAQANAERARQARREEDEGSKRDGKRDEMRDLLDKIRRQQQQ
ncbi:hypothetical protein FA10DRAFT_269492 [Acaromyces ingoldii]|uniref:Uncharacterized protein n=1 Tax=Acaromyces ingoldii TaxID=215250 RepID=A0A316YD00_9BASI|nr:hypothetical protein FA10DRAFT_269492 [Acaromyces ingoldii]PWN87540.1 hypothetical protein FA10DRAFT_269492 [Acaromyces ingoldii]